MVRAFLILAILWPVFLLADMIEVKTRAPQNRNAVFHYRVPKGYDKVCVTNFL